MRVVVAVDSFKGSLDSRRAGEAVARGVRSADPDGTVSVLLVADGGEGTLEAVAAEGATWVDTAAADPLRRPLRARYVVLADGTAVVEAARTIGLSLVGGVDASVPPRASSTGVGQQLTDALGRTSGRVLLGLGGSACTDGGTGLLRALGAEVRSGPAGNPLWDLKELTGPLPDLSRVTVLSDVTNPLLGPSGAATVFAAQKGATPDQVAHLESQLTRWADELTRAAGPVADLPGAGAAGGLGAALLACGAKIVPGFAELARLTGLAARMAGADVVITGEGSLDQQTTMGKAPAGVASLARAAGALAVGFGGRVDRPNHGFDAVFPIHSRPRPLSEALDPAITATELRHTAAEVIRLIVATGTLGFEAAGRTVP